MIDPGGACGQTLSHPPPMFLAAKRRKPGTLSKMPIGVRAAKRGLPPIPAFGIGWLYAVCPRRANLAIPRPFSSRRVRSPHNATDTKFPAQFAGNWLSVQIGRAHV